VQSVCAKSAWAVPQVREGIPVEARGIQRPVTPCLSLMDEKKNKCALPTTGDRPDAPFILLVCCQLLEQPAEN